MVVSQRRIKLFFLYCMMAYPLMMGAMCGDLFNKAKENANITITIERTQSFTIDVDEYMANANVQSQNGKIPARVGTITVPMDIPGQTLDFREHPDVQKYGSKLQHAKILGSVITVKSNTANVDIPPVEISMSPVSSESYQVVGTFTGVPAGQTGKSESLLKTSAAIDYASSLFVQFALKTKGKATMTLKGGQDVPKGKVTIDLNLKIQLSINPFK